MHGIAWNHLVPCMESYGSMHGIVWNHMESYGSMHGIVWNYIIVGMKLD